MDRTLEFDIQEDMRPGAAILFLRSGKGNQGSNPSESWNTELPTWLAKRADRNARILELLLATGLVKMPAGPNKVKKGPVSRHPVNEIIDVFDGIVCQLEDWEVPSLELQRVVDNTSDLLDEDRSLSFRDWAWLDIAVRDDLAEEARCLEWSIYSAAPSYNIEKIVKRRLSALLARPAPPAAV